MLRPVLAVLLATALLAASAPGVQSAARERTGGQLAAEADRLETAVADLRERESATTGSPGARRIVTVDLPARSRTAAGVDVLAIGGIPDGSASSNRTGVDLAWRVAEGATATRRLPEIRIAWLRDGDLVAEPLVLESPGEHRLALTLLERDDRPVVGVRRLPEV
ncbi:DUF7311 family protein [Halorientalis halophila]|uniref:DUF7311 family protein n=1 Tax=Halorientalis halophila TaxID=3108499 RepID=UPI00300B2A0F